MSKKTVKNQTNFQENDKENQHESNFLEIKKPPRLPSTFDAKQISSKNNETEIEQMMDLYDFGVEEEKSNYLSQIFEGARVKFDSNKEHMQSSIMKIIRKKEKENRKLAKKKYKRWSKVKGLLNFFLIMRSELFKRKIQGLTHLSGQEKNAPLE